MNTAKRVFDEVRVMHESAAREVLDFVGYLKAKRDRTKRSAQEVNEFDQFGVVFDGQFNREECYDRQIFH